VIAERGRSASAATVALTANEARCEAMIEQSLAMCTALAPEIGYDAAAQVAKESYRTGKTVREVAARPGASCPWNDSPCFLTRVK